MRRGWSGPIGIHAHNNMGQGLLNSTVAVESGASWVDGTITGMGRGAGNSATELLLLEFCRRGWGDSLRSRFSIWRSDRSRLCARNITGGRACSYHLSATYGVHPTYVQEMLERYL